MTGDQQNDQFLEDVVLPLLHSIKELHSVNGGLETVFSTSDEVFTNSEFQIGTLTRELLDLIERRMPR
jgi:hypothetical protein